MRALVLLASSLVFACGEDPAPEAPPEETPAVAEEQEVAEVEEETDDLEEEVPSLGETDLDAMERGELEAACFQGSQSACDRLGH